METLQFGWMFGVAVGLVALFLVLLWASGFQRGSEPQEQLAPRPYFIETRESNDAIRYRSDVLELDTVY